MYAGVHPCMLEERACAVHTYVHDCVCTRLCVYTYTGYVNSTCTPGWLPIIRSELLGAPWVAGWRQCWALFQPCSHAGIRLAAPNSAGVGLGGSWRNGALCLEELLLW